MILYFIRHGQSENNILNIGGDPHAARKADPKLTPKGKIQAETLGRFLECGIPAGGYSMEKGEGTGFGITHLYSSLMVRALETGTCVANHLGIPLIALHDLHEYGGVFIDDPESGQPQPLPGMSMAEFKRDFPDCIFPSDIQPNGWWAGRSFETREALHERATRVINLLLTKHENDRVAVISHSELHNEILAMILELPKKLGVWFTIHNTGITRVDFRSTERRVVYTNRTAHLPPDLLTA